MTVFVKSQTECGEWSVELYHSVECGVWSCCKQTKKELSVLATATKGSFYVGYGAALMRGCAVPAFMRIVRLFCCFGYLP